MNLASFLSVENIKDLSFYFGIFFTLAFVIRTFIPVDFSPEVNSDIGNFDTDASFNLFSLESIIAFLMSFCWICFLSLKLDYSLKMSFLISLLVGVFAMALFAFLITQFKKLETRVEPDLKDLVGTRGRAYLNFAPNGLSKIEIEFNSKLQILDAKNLKDEEIKAFEEIKVVKVENEIIYVEKI